jgi:hypothetical protein
MAHHVHASGTGGYKIQIQNLSDDNALAKTLTRNVPLSVRIAHPEDAAKFVFTPTTSGNYTFKTTGSLDTIGLVHDENDDFMAFDDDSGSGENCQITLYLEANQDYYFVVKHHELYMYNRNYNVIVE